MGSSIGVLNKDDDGINATLHNSNVIDNDSSLIETSELDIETTKIPKSLNIRKLISGAIKQNILFVSLSDEQIDELIDVFSPMKCSSGEIIIDIGDTKDYM